MINSNFKPLVTKLTVSSQAVRRDAKKVNSISKSASNMEFGRTISYRNRRENERYKRA